MAVCTMNVSLPRTARTSRLMSIVQSLPKVIASSMTASYTVLKHVDVERVDVRLGRNVEYTWSMSRLPILELECSKGSHLEREPCQTEEKFDFFRG